MYVHWSVFLLEGLNDLNSASFHASGVIIDLKLLQDWEVLKI